MIIDKDSKDKNDRTWSYWKKGFDPFDSIVFTSFDKIFFADPEFSKTFDISPYKYKMIKGIDFYNHTLDYLRSCDNTDLITDSIKEINQENNTASVITDDSTYQGRYVFKSYPNAIDYSASNFVWQHFKGLFVRFSDKTFEPNCARFMDFRVEQDGETRFFYVLPSDEYSALVEIAIFSDKIPKPSFYDPFIESYITNLISKQPYEMLEEEVGAIPMTDYNFNSNPQKNIINIGTNGGSVKGSSGYAFSYIQKETDRLLDYIISDKIDTYRPTKNRFKFYDRIFLNAILTGKTSGIEVFGKMFRKLSPQTIFKFLDEENNFLEDIKMFSAPPTIPFTKAFIEETFLK